MALPIIWPPRELVPDDTRRALEAAFGALQAARALVYHVTGYDDAQRTALLAARRCIDDALAHCTAFMGERDHQAQAFRPPMGHQATSACASSGQ
jgi:hypothetical protein